MYYLLCQNDQCFTFMPKNQKNGISFDKKLQERYFQGLQEGLLSSKRSFSSSTAHPASKKVLWRENWPKSSPPSTRPPGDKYVFSTYVEYFNFNAQRIKVLLCERGPARVERQWSRTRHLLYDRHTFYQKALKRIKQDCTMRWRSLFDWLSIEWGSANIANLPVQIFILHSLFLSQMSYS